MPRLFILLILLGTSAKSFAVQPSDEPANYAFATYMGTGIYGATDSSLFVLNMSKHFEWQKQPDIRFRLSGSAGFFGYDEDQIEELKLPDSIGTLTLIPSIEKVFTMSSHWELIPHIDLGLSKNFSTNEEAQIYAIGAQSRLYIDAENDRHLWVNKILWAGAKVLGSDQRDNYVKFLTGVDYKTGTYIDFAKNRTILTVYSLLSWSYNGIDYQERWKGSIDRDLDIELGISMFAPTPIDIGITDIQRVGFGIQHTAFGSVFRIFLGTPF